MNELNLFFYIFLIFFIATIFQFKKVIKELKKSKLRRKRI